MEELLACAKVLGVEVNFSPMDEREGAYYDDIGLILIDPRLSGEDERFTLAHEIGHAFLRHRGESKAEELLADEVAAALLIREGDLYQCAAMSDSEVFLGQELGVSSRAVEAFSRIINKRALLDRVHYELRIPAMRILALDSEVCMR